MKKTLLYLLSWLTLVGCIDKVQDVIEKNKPNPQNIEAMADFKIPVQENMASIVTVDGDTLAVTRYSELISVPRIALAAGKVKVTYSKEAIYENYGWSNYWQYISFEDSRAADYDYNDLVIHCRVMRTNAGYSNGRFLYKHTVAVRPVALGSWRTLKLGILYKKSESATEVYEKILCEDVRAELFNGDMTFPINTDSQQPVNHISVKMKDMFSIENYDATMKVAWFIQTDTDRLYAATANFDVEKSGYMFTSQGLPCGVVMTKHWDYPVEKCSILEAYPSFNEWMKTGDQDKLLNEVINEKVFPASFNKLWDYEN